MQTLVAAAPGTLREHLAQHALFRDLSPEHFDTLAECASEVRFDVGEMIFSEGQAATRFFLIVEGEVSLEVFHLEGGPLVIQTLGPGDVLGWSWLVPPYRWRFDARSLAHTRAIALDGARLRTECQQSPALGYELLKRFVLLLEQRLQATRQQLMEVGSVRW